tara:strand:- start:495 stop:1199 length:705 start_codon:yes stop_codon:yes gene_type:complete
MIGRITGILIHKGIDHVVIDVNGVGYEVFLSDRALAGLPPPGKQVYIFTELIVREDLLQLVGFLSIVDREWYRLLTSVQGVGPKAALKIMGSITTNVISRAILTGDATVIRAAQGIGQKIAQRIISELKDKAASLMANSPNLEVDPQVGFSSSDDSVKAAKFKDDNLTHEKTEFEENLDLQENRIQSEAVSALSNLGYTTLDAAEAINSILMDGNSYNVKELIKHALKKLAPKG